MKYAKATGEALSPQEKTSSTSKNETNYQSFSIFVGHFCPPGPTDPGTPLNPDPQHCFPYIRLLFQFDRRTRAVPSKQRYKTEFGAFPNSFQTTNKKD